MSLCCMQAASFFILLCQFLTLLLLCLFYALIPLPFILFLLCFPFLFFSHILSFLLLFLSFVFFRSYISVFVHSFPFLILSLSLSPFPFILPIFHFYYLPCSIYVFLSFSCSRWSKLVLGRSENSGTLEYRRL